MAYRASSRPSTIYIDSWRPSTTTMATREHPHGLLDEQQQLAAAQREQRDESCQKQPAAQPASKRSQRRPSVTNPASSEVAARPSIKKRAPPRRRFFDRDGDESDFEFEWAIHPHLIELPVATPEENYHVRTGVFNTMQMMGANDYNKLPPTTGYLFDSTASQYMQIVAKCKMVCAGMSTVNSFYQGPVSFPTTGRGLPWTNCDGTQADPSMFDRYYFEADTAAPDAWRKDTQQYAFFSSYRPGCTYESCTSVKTGLIVVRNVVRLTVADVAPRLVAAGSHTAAASHGRQHAAH